METCLIKPSTNRKLHSLLASTGTTERKADLVHAHTGGRTEHSSSMQEFEAINLIDYLAKEYNEEATKCQNMRRKIIAICHTLGWYAEHPNGSMILHNNQPVLDFVRIDKFCIERGNAHKHFQKHNSKELSTLVTIFEKL